MDALLVATTNPGKVREIRRALAGVPVALVTLDEFDVPAPDETGTTFAENAELKARAYASATGLPTVAEDSGLAIDALGGRPGVQSARYPGETYADKFANLYRELAAHARPWTAQFVCALAFVEPGSRGTSPTFACQTVVKGDIAAAPRGAYGFGYDPIFFYPPYGRTLGEVTDEEKLAVSHRGKAFAKFREWLTSAVLLCGLTLVPGARLPLVQPQPPDLDAWRQAVEEHQPGAQDHAAVVISTWPTTTLNVLLQDWLVLAKQWRTNRLDRIRRVQLDTLHIANSEAMVRFVKRAAVLHADVAMLLPRHDPAASDPWSAGAALLVGDGQHLGYASVSSHWSLGRALLDTLPTPADDEMTRRWYIATGAYLQAEKDFADDLPHLARGQELFPADPRLLFLSGAIHEIYASPEIQSAVNGMRATAPNTRSSVQSSMVEWHTAAEFYRRAVAADAANAEFRLRLGRVTGLLGRHRDAITTLTSAKQALEDPALRYVACLFLGRERHQLKEADLANAEFHEAAQLFPNAHAPQLALSQIAGELGQRDRSIAELDAIIGRTDRNGAGNDPWLDYLYFHLRALPAWVRELYDAVPPAVK